MIFKTNTCHSINSKSALLLSIIFMFSCNNKKEDKVAIEPDRKDSSTRIAPERKINPYATVDVSPMDMAYFPPEYPKLKMSNATTQPPLARVVYSRPHLDGRTLFQDLLKYGEPWRLGANESTELELYRDATIEGKKIKAGRYILYCIPQKDQWKIILNSNIDTWGLEQDASKDIASFLIPAKQTERSLEFYTMVFEKTKAGANLVMAWDNWEARLAIQF
jgi:hypothetical protein